MPGWVRAWFRTPFIDRYAHVWMWNRGGWEVAQSPEQSDGGDAAAVRKPRRSIASVGRLAADVQAQADRPSTGPNAHGPADIMLLVSFSKSHARAV
jgi:hypothetical protein